MNKSELLEYINSNSAAITIFKDKVRTEQETKNKKRQPAKRWNEAKIERTVDKFTDVSSVMFMTSSIKGG